MSLHAAFAARDDGDAAGCGVDIRAVQELLGYKKVTATQIHDKRRRSTVESARLG